MEKILRDIAKILNFSDSFFEEVESLGNLGFYETDMINGVFKASAGYKRLFNLPEREFYRREEFEAQVHPDDIVWVLEEFNTCMSERRNFESEYRVIVKGDVRYFCGQSVFVSDEGGNLVKVIGMKRDITNEKLAELEKEEYIKKLEQARSITTTIVHDLKAPIHNIRMIAELLKGSMAEGSESLIEMLEESCLRSYEIIDDVLEKSLIEEESHKIEKESCNIYRLVDKAIRSLSYTAKKKNIEIIVALQPDIYAFVHQKKLQRAIENLLYNAIKFSHEDGQIEISLYGKENSFVVMVKDFGLGMNEFQKVLLFHKDNPFRKKGTWGEKSSGLGMNIVKTIIDQHQGKIKVESQESVGTTFFIELPKE